MNFDASDFADSEPDSLTILRRIADGAAASPSMVADFDEEMKNVARWMAKTNVNGKRGINRVLMSELIKSFAYLHYEALITNTSLGDQNTRDENIVYLLLPPNYSFYYDPRLDPETRRKVVPLHNANTDEIFYLVPEMPHKGRIILFRDENDELCIPHDQGPIIPLDLTASSVKAIGGTVGKNLTKAFQDGMTDMKARRTRPVHIERQNELRRTDPDVTGVWTNETSEEEDAAIIRRMRFEKKRLRAKNKVKSAPNVPVIDAERGKDPVKQALVKSAKKESKLSIDPAIAETTVRSEHQKLLSEQKRQTKIVEATARMAKRAWISSTRESNNEYNITQAVESLRKKLADPSNQSKKQQKSLGRTLEDKTKQLGKFAKRSVTARERARAAETKLTNAQHDLDTITQSLRAYDQGVRKSTGGPKFKSQDDVLKDLVELQATYLVLEKSAWHEQEVAAYKANLHAQAIAESDAAKAKLENLKLEASRDLTSDLTQKIQTAQRDLNKKELKAVRLRKTSDQAKRQAEAVNERMNKAAEALASHQVRYDLNELKPEIPEEVQMRILSAEKKRLQTERDAKAAAARMTRRKDRRRRIELKRRNQKERITSSQLCLPVARSVEEGVERPYSLKPPSTPRAQPEKGASSSSSKNLKSDLQLRRALREENRMVKERQDGPAPRRLWCSLKPRQDQLRA